MGANLNKTEMSLFIIDKPEWKNGAIAIGAPNFAKNIVWNPTIDIPKKDSAEEYLVGLSPFIPTEFGLSVLYGFGPNNHRFG